MAKSSGQERREYPRTEVSWPVRMWASDDMIVGRAVDVSQQGLCVLTAPTDALKRGQCYRVDVVLGAGDQFSCQAEVRHISSTHVGLRTI